MKTIPFLACGFTIFFAHANGAEPPTPRIFKFGHNGALIAGGFAPGTVGTIEWASSLDGPWTNTWAGLRVVVADSRGIINVKVPMFYRVRVGPTFPDPEEMAWIPPGTFMMGSPSNELDRLPDEGPQTEVTISQGFWIGRFEVTQAEYLQVMGVNPSAYPDMDSPVEQVSWFDATNYCGRLTELERGAGRLPAGCVYRLPTEAEWERACRAETTTRFSYGDDLGYTELDSHAWHYDNSASTPHRVGEKLPNPWGVYDVHGNVWEWCLDWWMASLPGGSVIDPTGPVNGSFGVHRSGSAGDQGGRYFRSAARGRSPRELRSWTTGFRVLLARPWP